MEPPLTTIRVGPRIEIYGPMSSDLFKSICKCIDTCCPHATCTGDDPYTQLMMTIYLDLPLANNIRKEILPCQSSTHPSGIPSPSSADGSVETAPTAGT